MPPRADFEHVLDIADGQAVAGDGIAVDIELDVIATHVRSAKALRVRGRP